MIKTLVSLCLIAGSIYSQTFQLGLRSESTWYNTTNGIESVPLSHVFVTAGLHEENVPLVNNLTEEIRFGRTFDPYDMAGNDLVLALKSRIINTHISGSWFYTTLGLNMHSNIGDNGAGWAVYVKRIYMLMFGIGFTMDKFAFVEVSTYIPVSNSVIGETDLITMDNSLIREPWKLNSLIAINFGLTLDIGKL